MLPSVSMKSGSGNFAAKDVLPTPSGPYTITFCAFCTAPRVMLSAIYITHLSAGRRIGTRAGSFASVRTVGASANSGARSAACPSSAPP